MIWGQDEHGNNWQNVVVRKEQTWDNNIVFWCFPENVEPRKNLYPGFAVLETWIEENLTSATYKRFYNEGSPLLAVKIREPAELLQFALTSEYRDRTVHDVYV